MQNKLAMAMAALCFALPAGTMVAQAGGNAGSQAQSGGGGGQMGMLATLDKGVDAKKAKVGDPVIAKTTVDLTDNKGGKVPSGSKLMGHVTEVQAKDGTNQESHLAFSFDSLQPKNGGAPIPLKLELAGVSPPPQVRPGMMDGGGAEAAAQAPTPTPSGSGAPSGGSSAPSQSSMPTSAPSGSDSSAPAASAASLTGSTVRDVTLNGTTLTSTKRNVSLSEGSTLTLVMVPQTAPAQQPPAGQ